MKERSSRESKRDKKIEIDEDIIYEKLLFIGDNPEQFINSFINIYSGVNYEDNFRYKIFSDN